MGFFRQTYLLTYKTCSHKVKFTVSKGLLNSFEELINSSKTEVEKRMGKKARLVDAKRID